MAMTHAPIAFEPMMMKDVGDCSVCCLVMLLGKTYAQVLAACPKRSKPTKTGLSIGQMENVARRLGAVLVYDEASEEDEVGILDISRTDDNNEHVVMYIRGAVFNPADGMLWTDADVFLQNAKWKVEGFLWRKR